MKDKSPFCEGDRVIWGEQPDKTWHVHYRWNEEYVNIINKFKGGFTSIRVHVDKIRHANRKEELKQAIREVLMSDEFLKAFSAAISSKLQQAGTSSEPPKQTTEGYFDDIEGCWVDEKNPFEGRKNSDKIPEGYRKLADSSEEPRQLGDLRWSVTEGRYVKMSVQEIGYANRDNWAACRKVEDAK